jgi:hypothetical protein
MRHVHPATTGSNEKSSGAHARSSFSPHDRGRTGRISSPARAVPAVLSHLRKPSIGCHAGAGTPMTGGLGLRPPYATGAATPNPLLRTRPPSLPRCTPIRPRMRSPPPTRGCTPIRLTTRLLPARLQRPRETLSDYHGLVVPLQSRGASAVSLGLCGVAGFVRCRGAYAVSRRVSRGMASGAEGPAVQPQKQRRPRHNVRSRDVSVRGISARGVSSKGVSSKGVSSKDAKGTAPEMPESQMRQRRQTWSRQECCGS